MTAQRPWVLVLAGGDGTRLQALTRVVTGRPIPKQYCRLYGGRSLLEATLERAAHLADPDRIAVIINRSHLEVCRSQVAAVLPRNLIVQPCNRDTGPGIVLALLHLFRADPAAVVAVLPSDHFVDDDAAFVAYLQEARELVAARPEALALLGIVPDVPDCELGYLSVGAAVTPHVFKVAAFHEKPDRESADRLVRNGALWNSFVMVFRVSRVLELLEGLLPDEVERICRISDCPATMAAGYAGLPPWNFSCRFLSHIVEHLLVVRVDGLHWSDWGTPAAIARTFARLNQPLPWRADAACEVGG